MRTILYLFLCTFCLMCGNRAATSSESVQVPEAKWARGIADDFWKACLSDNSEQAAGLLSAELTQALTIYDKSSVYLSASDRICKIISNFYHHKEKTVSFSSEEISPDHSEAVFKGVITAKDPTLDLLTSDFTMRIAKEGAAGRWSIRYLLITERKEPSGKTNINSWLDSKAAIENKKP